MDYITCIHRDWHTNRYVGLPVRCFLVIHSEEELTCVSESYIRNWISCNLISYLLTPSQPFFIDCWGFRTKKFMFKNLNCKFWCICSTVYSWCVLMCVCVCVCVWDVYKRQLLNWEGYITELTKYNNGFGLLKE